MTDYQTDRGWVGVPVATAVPVEEERHAAPSSEISEPSTSGLSQREDGFIQHKILKTDTLAGLALKYNVTVSDLKRANGLLTDTAMFAREYIQIPTKPLPMGEDAQVLFARLLSGYGRDASLNSSERKAPGTVAAAQLPGSPIAGSRCCSEEDDTGTPYSRRSDRSATEPGDVELMERQAGGEFMANGGAGGYGSDRVRRRHRPSNTDAAAAALQNASAAALAAASTLGSMAGVAADAALSWLAAPVGSGDGAGGSGSGIGGAAGVARGPRAPSAGSSSRVVAGREVVGQTWQQLSSATNSLVEKIKRAASQPALAGAGGHHGGGFGEAADMVLSQRSVRTPSGTGPGAGLGLAGGGVGGAGAGMGLGDLLARTSLPPLTVKKGCSKND